MNPVRAAPKTHCRVPEVPHRTHGKKRDVCVTRATVLIKNKSLEREDLPTDATMM